MLKESKNFRVEAELYNKVDVNINELLKVATKESKVAFVPGNPFFVNSNDGNKSLRLNFSSNTPETIRIGMKRLGDVFDLKS